MKWENNRLENERFFSKERLSLIDFTLKDLESRFKGINPKEYYLSYSAGKDSGFLYWFIKQYIQEYDIEIVASNTFLEHEELRDLMYKNADVVLTPNITPNEVKEKYGIPCFSKSQDGFIDHYQKGGRAPSIMARIKGTDEKSWYNLNSQARELTLSNELHRVSPNCCEYFKKRPFREYEKKTGKKAILGITGNEGVMRSSSYKGCFTTDKKFIPLHDVEKDLIDDIIKLYDIPTPSVYEVLDRTGCVGCPYSSIGGEAELSLSLASENQRKYITNYFKESYKVLGVNYEKDHLEKVLKAKVKEKSLFSKLKEIMKKNDEDISDLAKVIGTTKRTFENKLKGKTQFRLDEIIKISRHYELSDEEIIDCFMKEKVL